jgi:hypothetical protein
MARNININFTTLVKGAKVQVDRWTTTETITWFDDSGIQHTWTGTITYPDDLALMTASWQKNALLDLIFRASRIKLGIDAEAI